MPTLRSISSGALLRSAALASALFAAAPLAAQTMPSHDGEGMSTKLQGFVDVDYRSRQADEARRAGFSLGQFDLYLNSRLTDRLGFVGETVFEYEDAEGEFVVDVERVIVQFAMTPHLRLSAGKMHTPIGYWNNAYHHGLVMQPTIERPRLVSFEDEGGSLPVHTVGAQLSGRDLTPLHLGFDAMVGNGLGNRATADARNAAQAVTLAVHSQVTADLKVGLSAYRDQLAVGSASPMGDTLSSAMTQLITGGFVSYFGDRAELVAEGHRVANRVAGRTSFSPGWFAYAGWRNRTPLVPYLVHDELRLADGDPYFAAGSSRQDAFGLRYEWAATAASKLELRSVRREDGVRRGEVAAQMAVAF
jgi:hypothetical protein